LDRGIPAIIGVVIRSEKVGDEITGVAIILEDGCERAVRGRPFDHCFASYKNLFFSSKDDWHGNPATFDVN